MKTQVAVLTMVALCVVWFGGCGGNQSGTVETEPVEQTVMSGPLQIGVAATAGFKQLPIPTPANSGVALTAFYGAKITRLTQMGPGKIAFQMNAGTIATIRPDGTGQVAVTNGSGFDRNPVWSPSGNKVAFSSLRGGNRDIYTMNADGSAVTRVTNSAAQEGMPSWSPDGKRLAWVRTVGDSPDVCVSNADGTAAVNLTNNADYDLEPTWSPDGREILFTSDRDGDLEVFAMRPDGTGLRQLTINTVSDGSAAWSPDGEKIVFRSSRETSNELWVMNADGSGPVGLNVVGLAPCYTFDGREIVFTNIANDLYIARANGTHVRRVNQTGSAAYPSCSPTPARARALVGKANEDNGSNPPFGDACHLAIMGLTDADGLVEAAALLVPNWNTLKVTTPNYGGNSLAVLEISGTALEAMVEDRGPGIGVRRWTFPTSPATGSATVFFSASTGQIRSILTASDSVGTAASGAAGVKSGRLVLNGSFTSVMDARDPSANLASGLAHQVTIDAKTGQVLGSQ